MADKNTKIKREAYKCTECDLEYLGNVAAKECWNWCKKHKSCNLNITKNAINK